MATWVQPTLGGASVRHFLIVGSFSWPAGWHGRLDVVMEGEALPATILNFAELDTPQLYAVIDRVSELLSALLGADD